MPGNLRPTELLIILLVLFLLFGAKKLPDTARGLGQALRIFKSETKGLREDGKEAAAPQPQAPAAPRELDPAPDARSPERMTNTDRTTS
jgi:sec-independent protein translocase protein TatA